MWRKEYYAVIKNNEAVLTILKWWEVGRDVPELLLYEQKEAQK